MWSTKERHGWMFFLLFGGMGLYASRTILPISLISLTSEMKWNRKEAGLVLGVFFWGYALTQFLAGYLSDRLGGERVIPCTSFLWSTLTLSFIYLPIASPRPDVVYGLFVCTRFFLGVFQGFYYPSIISLMAKRVHSGERNFTHAVLNAGTHLGTLLCGSLGSYLVAVYGWRVPFAMIGCAFGLWALATYIFMVRGKRIPCNLVPPLDRFVTTGSKGVSLGTGHSFIPVPENMLSNDKKVIESHHILVMQQSSPAKHSANACKPPRPLAWDVLLRHPPFWAMLLANFAHNNSFYIILNWCPSYFHDNYPDARSWVFNMVPWLIIFPCVLLSGLIADHWIVQGVSVTLVRKTINTVVLLGSAVFLLLLCVLDNYYAALTCIALALACLGFHSSGVLLNPQDIAPTHSGELYGVMATVGTLPGFTGVYFTGYLLEMTHQWSTVFLLTSLVSLVGWLVYTRYGSSDPLK